MCQPLTHVVAWSQRLLAEVLSPGDIAVDLTAGQGYDTLMLAKTVGPSGSVLAFDLQQQALEISSERLSQQGVVVNRLECPVPVLPSGVSLVLGNHATLVKWNWLNPQAIIANLGYLPSGDKKLVTQPDTTLKALQASCEILAPGGRIAVVVYPGHLGGQREAEVVEHFFDALDERQFEVVRLQVVGRQQSPFLLTAGKFN